MSSYKNFFDSIIPQTTGEEMLAAVKGAARSRKSNMKRVAAFVTASFAAAALGVSVLAYNPALMDSIRAFFGDKNNIISENINDVQVLSSGETFDELDISLVGAVSDESFTVIFIDVLRNDGGVFDTSDHILTDADGNELIMSDGEKCVLSPSIGFMDNKSRSVTCSGVELAEAARVYLVKDNEPTDNKMTLAYCISGLDREICESIRLELCDLVIRSHGGSEEGGKIHLQEKDRELFCGDFMCMINTDSIAYVSRAKVISPDTRVNIPISGERSGDTGHEEFTVKEISVSGVSVKLRLEGELSEEGNYIETYSSEGIGSVILKDKTVLPFGNERLPQIILEHTEGNTWYFEGSFILPQTVEPDVVDSIAFGDDVIEID